MPPSSSLTTSLIPSLMSARYCWGTSSVRNQPGGITADHFTLRGDDRINDGGVIDLAAVDHCGKIARYLNRGKQRHALADARHDRLVGVPDDVVQPSEIWEVMALEEMVSVPILRSVRSTSADIRAIFLVARVLHHRHDVTGGPGHTFRPRNHSQAHTGVHQKLPGLLIHQTRRVPVGALLGSYSVAWEESWPVNSPGSSTLVLLSSPSSVPHLLSLSIPSL